MKKTAYNDFIARLSLLIQKHPQLITTVLGNIFTMRLIGNKTHGDLAEIAIAEFINQYMYDFKSVHVGKELYRAKKQEEDITVENEIDGNKFPVSLKAYGDGPLQLSTDKECKMFSYLEKYGNKITRAQTIKKILNSPEFSSMRETNILPLIYNEKDKKCNIMIFNADLAIKSIDLIERIDEGKVRKHPIYKFMSKKTNYVCEVRYGGASANALQRGLWTHTKNAFPFFNSVTNGWVTYKHNLVLVKVFSHALVASKSGHESALKEIKQDILRLKTINKIEQ